MLEENIEIPADFFAAEERCGYLVDEKRKKIWAAELGLLDRFARVCAEHDLHWFAMGGTLLGAVRHKGFIPWDDDIDVIMPRRDYDKLLEIGSGEFAEPYFFQTPETERDFFRTHVQIRDSRTTGAIGEDIGRDINRGIFIDVFVLDESPDDPVLLERHRRALRRLTRKASHSTFVHEYRSAFKRAWYRLLATSVFGRGYSAAEYFRRFQAESRKYSGAGCSRAAHTALSYRDGVIWDAADWSETVMLDFEMMKIPAPKGFDAILRRQYGDYTVIPDDKNGTAHGHVIFEPEISYKDYFKTR